jgi:hypothetical protein
MEKTDKQRSDKEPMLKPDALIERIAPDASEVPDVRVLAGFLGKSTRRGHWRLYLTPTLNEYVEFAEDDVVHSHSLETDENRLGGTVVWVRREANLVHTKAVSREAQADFLHGDIATRYLVAARSGGPLGLPIGGSGFLANPHYSAWISCVPEFCDIAPLSFLGGGTAYCTRDSACGTATQSGPQC